MACNICGEGGHNSRTCPQLLPASANDSGNTGDHAIWLRYGGLTKEQVKIIKHKFEEIIEAEAPDSYGVIAAGNAKKLPERIQLAMQNSQDSAKQLKKKDD